MCLALFDFNICTQSLNASHPCQLCFVCLFVLFGHPLCIICMVCLCVSMHILVCVSLCVSSHIIQSKTEADKSHITLIYICLFQCLHIILPNGHKHQTQQFLSYHSWCVFFCVSFFLTFFFLTVTAQFWLYNIKDWSELKQTQVCIKREKNQCSENTVEALMIYWSEK